MEAEIAAAIAMESAAADQRNVATALNFQQKERRIKEAKEAAEHVVQLTSFALLRGAESRYSFAPALPAPLARTGAAANSSASVRFHDTASDSTTIYIEVPPHPRRPHFVRAPLPSAAPPSALLLWPPLLVRTPRSRTSSRN